MRARYHLPSHRKTRSDVQAVGKDRFREDARKVMLVLQQLQAPGLLEADDPTMGYMMQVWGGGGAGVGWRGCRCGVEGMQM